MRELFRGFTLMYGPPGSGKTSLALYAAAQMGQKVMYVGFYETADKVQEKIKGLGLDLSKFVVFDYLSISNVDVLLFNIVDAYEKTSPDVVILDGINALPQSREVAASVYRIFHTPTIAIGEEQIAGSHFAYIADTLLEVSQVFHRGGSLQEDKSGEDQVGA
jgi:DNA repair protein RadA/Sms